jgi:hypothetical protein
MVVVAPNAQKKDEKRKAYQMILKKHSQNGGATICVEPPNCCHKAKILDGVLDGETVKIYILSRISILSQGSIDQLITRRSGASKQKGLRILFAPRNRTKPHAPACATKNPLPATIKSLSISVPRLFFALLGRFCHSSMIANHF